MSVSGVSASGSSSLYQSSNPQKNIQASFKQMADAIQNGDLTGAQSAYGSLAQLLNGGQQTTQAAAQSTSQGSANPTGSFADLLNQIGSALQSGDLTGAQQALQSLQQAAQTHRHHHHHGAGPGGAQGGGSQAGQTASSSNAPGTGSSDASATTDPLAATSGISLTV
jgi:hypothetical protein